MLEADRVQIFRQVGSGPAGCIGAKVHGLVLHHQDFPCLETKTVDSYFKQMAAVVPGC